MGRNDEDSHDVPVVHPELCVIEDHFRRNTSFMNVAADRFLTRDQRRVIYNVAPKVSFEALTKLVK